MLDLILLFEIESVRLVFCHWNQVRRNRFPLNWNQALQTRFQFSSPTIKTLLLQQIQANPERPITKSTNPPNQCCDCGSNVDSKLRVKLGEPWRYCVRNGMVVHLRRRGASSSSSLELAVWVWVGWGFNDEEEARTCTLRYVGLGGLRFSDEEARTSQCGTVSVRNYIKPITLDFTLRNSSSTGSSSMFRRTHKTSLLDSSCYSELNSNTLELLVS